MSLTIAIVGEAWEASFARATAASLSSWLPAEAIILVPRAFEEAVKKVAPRPLRVFSSTPLGFHAYDEVRRCVIEHASGEGKGTLILAAGTQPVGANPLEHLGASYRVERFIEWLPTTESASQTVVHFYPPPHKPPAQPLHTVEQVGMLDLWTVDGGDQYFQALATLASVGGPPVWSQYGSHQPIFIYNTNDFSEAAVTAHDDYVILASGLLGLRMIIESEPERGAHVIVYDINRDQLDWVKFLLKVCAQIGEFKKVVEEFCSTRPLVSIRQTLSHEMPNVLQQDEWYRKNHRHLAELTSQLEWEFIECDIWNNPLTLLDRLKPSRKLFFMYLDLFMVWHVNNESPWVEKHSGIAASLEQMIKERVTAPVTFLPGPHSRKFQLQPTSPFALSRRESPCT